MAIGIDDQSEEGIQRAGLWNSIAEASEKLLQLQVLTEEITDQITSAKGIPSKRSTTLTCSKCRRVATVLAGAAGQGLCWRCGDFENPLALSVPCESCHGRGEVDLQTQPRGVLQQALGAVEADVESAEIAYAEAVSKKPRLARRIQTNAVPGPVW